jgi:hypothetical protein
MQHLFSSSSIFVVFSCFNNNWFLAARNHTNCCCAAARCRGRVINVCTTLVETTYKSQLIIMKQVLVHTYLKWFGAWSIYNVLWQSIHGFTILCEKPFCLIDVLFLSLRTNFLLWPLVLVEGSSLRSGTCWSSVCMSICMPQLGHLGRVFHWTMFVLDTAVGPGRIGWNNIYRWAWWLFFVHFFLIG